MDIYTSSSPPPSQTAEKKGRNNKNSNISSLMRLTIFLCCLWSVTILYGEMVSYWVPLWTCSWPSSNDNQAKIAVIADPQLMDSTTHGFAPKSFLLESVQFITDIYMRRAFYSSILPFKPDMILFLGDHFDGGPYLSDEEWQGSLSRFKHIFGLNEQRKNPYIPIHYLSGNHDIGYSAFYTQHPEVISRYEKEFGKRNYNFSVGKVDFIVVDAQTLDGPKRETETTSSWDFINNISKSNSQNPRVLLTHIPMYRPDGTPCGKYRSSPIINQRVHYSAFDHGVRYQNYLTKETSNLLLSLLNPILVLSGHDHDQCTVSHSTPSGSATEHSLGTLSWQQGNLYPSFMLLSVASGNSFNDSSSNSDSKPNQLVSTQLCFLPMQTHIYIWYLCHAILTLLLLAIYPTNGLTTSSKLGKYLYLLKTSWTNFTAKVKEKDDEDCEYEMVWDAEGAMHLVKKVVERRVGGGSNLDTKVASRGNVVSRGSTRKQHQLEPANSVSVDINTELISDDSTKLQVTKSRAFKAIQRLIRVVRLVVVILAVNVPIYMMLLFKDWVER
ncbi:hypothetical protein LUZ60_006585 [Juncus effusus]|nr:hypothetical protein LUZ60_006585 [Juncus effusus]